jgi:hypothetical protein
MRIDVFRFLLARYPDVVEALAVDARIGVFLNELSELVTTARPILRSEPTSVERRVVSFRTKGLP